MGGGIAGRHPHQSVDLMKPCEHCRRRMDASRMIQTARQHLQEGRPADALNLCRQVLAGDPNEIAAMELAGAIAFQSDAMAEAIAWFSRIVALQPTAHHWADLG